MQSDKEAPSPSLGEKHEKSPKQLYSGNASPNLGEEHEKSLLQEKPAEQLYSVSNTHETGEGHKISAEQLDQGYASPNLGEENEKSPEQLDVDPASVSPSLGEGHKKSPKQLDSASASLNLSEKCQETENHSDMEDSLKLSEQYQKAVESTKRKRKRSLEMAAVSRDSAADGSTGSRSNQLVVYEPSVTDAERGALVAFDEKENNTATFRTSWGSHSSGRLLPSIGAFTVQCNKCFKWRLMPTKEKYEKIREIILQNPFTCEDAREWRPDITCEDPTDISQDGSRLWAIDKPNIAQPPPGWERILRLRAEGGTRFADVYYATPSGKKLRSMIEIQRYLLEHPEYTQQGVNLSKFSFQIPRPLQEDYVKKRPQQDKLTSGSDPGGLEFSKSPEHEEGKPIAWVAPPTHKELEAGGSDTQLPILNLDQPN